jgi:poly-gamma-glutamate synthesis protein (capsule biosynthesis protein)
MKNIKTLLLSYLIFTCLLTACTKASPSPTSVLNTLTPEPSPTVAQPTLITQTIWVDPILQSNLGDQIQPPSDWQLVSDSSQASYLVELNGKNPISNLVFALVSPFPTITDDIASADFKEIWKSDIKLNSKFHKLLMDKQTLQLLTLELGTPAANLIDTLPSDQLLDTAWNTTGDWAIIPFTQIEPRWKVISIDGISPIHKDFKPDNYFLNFLISIEANSSLPSEKQIVPSELATWIPSNRDASKLTTLVMTGTTAMVRGTAALMEKNGMTYPALIIGDLLRSADITHVSNEIAFSPTCPHPHFQGDELMFCSRPEYIQLLEYIGTDVVDMTGDHFIDVPPSAVLYTLDMYKELGWGYFAGGANIEDAKAPLFKNVNSNSIAFIGCNAKPIGYALASATNPGSVHCDWNYLDNEIPLILKDGYLPIMTFSHIEYYQYEAIPKLIVDFHHAADDGAIIVSGSQAHQPQAMEFYKGSFLHYGLGNLFFDQYYESLPQRQAFIDRHVFYNGKYISTELITIEFVDNAQSRFMTPEERADLLNTIFKASGWQNINP